MQETARIQGGSMVSVMGIDRMSADKLAFNSQVKVANYNSYDQFVISGAERNIDEVIKKTDLVFLALPHTKALPG